jgi:nitrogen fixation NifU-like protein
MPKYSDILMEHFTAPQNAGALESPDRMGVAGDPERPPYLVLVLKLDGEVIRQARYSTYGCGAAIAAGSLYAELIIGKTIDQASAITPQQLLLALDSAAASDERGSTGIAPRLAVRTPLSHPIATATLGALSHPRDPLAGGRATLWPSPISASRVPSRAMARQQNRGAYIRARSAGR